MPGRQKRKRVIEDKNEKVVDNFGPKSSTTTREGVVEELGQEGQKGEESELQVHEEFLKTMDLGEQFKAFKSARGKTNLIQVESHNESGNQSTVDNNDGQQLAKRMGIFKEDESSKKSKIEAKETGIEEKNPFNMYTVMESIVKQMSLGDLKNARLLNQDWSQPASKEIERRWEKLEVIKVNLQKNYPHQSPDTRLANYIVDLAKLKEFRATLPGSTSLGLFPNFSVIGRHEQETLKSDIMGSSHLEQFFGELEPKMLILTVRIGEIIGPIPPRTPGKIRGNRLRQTPPGLKLKEFYGLLRTCSDTLKELNVTFESIRHAQFPCKGQSESPYEIDAVDFKFPHLEKIQFKEFFLGREMKNFSFGQMIEILGKGFGFPKLKILSLQSCRHNFPTDLPESFERIGLTKKLEELSINVSGHGVGITSTLHKLASNGLRLKSFTLIWGLEFKNWSEYKGDTYIGGLRTFLETQAKSLQNLKIHLTFDYDAGRVVFTDQMSTNLLDLSIFTKLKKVNLFWPKQSPKLIADVSTSVNFVEIDDNEFLNDVSVGEFFPKMKKLTIIFPYHCHFDLQDKQVINIPLVCAETLQVIKLELVINSTKNIRFEPLLKCKTLNSLELIFNPYSGDFYGKKRRFEEKTEMDNNFIDQLKEMKIRTLVIKNFIISEAQEKILKENFGHLCLKGRSNEDDSSGRECEND